MIQIRSTDGTVQTISGPFRFVELCDTTGSPAIVAYMDEQKQLHILVEGTEEANRYEKAFGVKFCKFKEINKQ
jgi:hypothetical protein